MDVDKRSYWELATNHLEEGDFEILKRREVPLNYYDYEEGGFLSWSSDLTTQDWKRIAESKLSNAFYSLLKTADDNGIHLIRFDRDTDPSPEFQTFDW